MEKYNLPTDIKVFGFLVATFPAGIEDAFNILKQKTGDCTGDRNYFGLSEYKDGKMAYYALAEEKFTDEGEQFDYEKFTVEKGDYLTVRVSEWHQKTSAIKDVFSKIIQDPRVNSTKPAVEWYKSEDEMMCLVQMNN